MKRQLLGWLVERPTRAAVVTVGCSILLLQGLLPFAVLASAIPVLILLERGPKAGIGVMLAGSAAMVGLFLGFQQSPWIALAYAAALFGVPVLMAELLRRTGSLNLVFQVTLLLALAVIAGVFVGLPQPVELWREPVAQVVTALQQADLVVDATLVQRWVEMMWGAVLALLMLVNLGSVWLARWFQSLIHAPGEFGREFHQLSSGVVLGSLLVAVSLASLFVDVAWLDSLAQVAIMGLALQVVAAAHRRKAEGRLRQGWLVVFYLVLIATLSSFVTVVLLAGLGLADFWRRMRMTALRA